MSRLEELSEQQLAPQFVSMATDFCDHILRTSPVKVVGGLEFNGRGMLKHSSNEIDKLDAKKLHLIKAFSQPKAD